MLRGHRGRGGAGRGGGGGAKSHLLAGSRSVMFQRQCCCTKLQLLLPVSAFSKQWLPALQILGSCLLPPPADGACQLPHPLVQELEGELAEIERDVRMLSKASVVRIAST